MVDAQTHLRDADTDADLQWDPAAPNHTTMDNFCMSCHDGNGATSPASVAIQAVINTIPAGAGRVGTASALNPFGDTISNQYDQLSRGAVVAVKEQFDAGNTSHHAVRAPRYSASALTSTQFANISSANFDNGSFGVSRNSQPADATILATIGTLYQTNKLSQYVPFGATSSLADNSSIHCADCHTVGQWKPNTTQVVNSDGTLGAAVATVIGAHGSQNEYMLRNSNGSDSTLSSQTYMVCYICHAASGYGTPASGSPLANSHDSAISHTSGNDCNGGGNNNQGLVGASRLDRDFSLTNTSFGGDNYGKNQLASGTLSGGGAGNLLGNKCSNCHNSSDNKNFGGIHGNAFRVGATPVVTMNASYKTYSSANGSSSATPQPITLVDRKPYRFLPGLGNFRYNGGADSNAWTRKAIGAAGKSEKLGCYTLNGASSKKRTNSDGTFTYIPAVAPTKAQASGVNVSSTAVADDNGILGSWGACTDHGGSSFTGSGRSTTRTNLRPLTY
jgi:nitrate/TMAO reductase-like tetraheme cytochrome c subunit